MKKSNNIEIDVDRFRKMIIEEQLSKSKVARELNISRRTVVKLMERYNIEREDAWTKVYDVKLNDMQKQVLYGTLLGDACLFVYPTSKNPSLLVYHSIAQKKYVELKLSIFKEFVYKERLQTVKRKNGKRICFRTCCHPEFDYFYNLFYKNKKKEVTQEILDNLTPLSLAFWFCDDGSRCKHRGLAIHTNSFTLEEVEMICKWFYDQYEIITKPQKRKENQWVVFFSNKTSDKFANLILPYVIPSMKYKFEGVFLKNPQRPYEVPFIL